MALRLDRDEIWPEADFRLIWLSCALRDHRMAYLLNTALRMELWRQDDFVGEGQDGAPQFTQFLWDDPVAGRSVTLLSNRSSEAEEVSRPGDLFGAQPQSLLLPELPRADYLLLFQGDFDPSELEEMTNEMNATPPIIAAALRDPNTLKGYINLMC